MNRLSTPPYRIHIKEFCDRESTDTLRGLCMLLIIFHHIYAHISWQMNVPINIPIPYLSSVLAQGGYLGTGVFLFLSGYGLYFSLIKQSELKLAYLTTRLRKLFFCFISMFMISVCINYKSTIEDIFYSLITLTIPNASLWFFKVIIGLYILCYFSFRYLKKNAVFIVCLTSLVYFIFARKYLEDWWYSSILCFPVGMLTACYKKYLKTWIQVAFVPLFIYAFFRLGNNDTSFITAICFSYASLFAMRLIHIKSRILTFIGINSLSFYLFHCAFLSIDNIVPIKPWLYAILIILLTIVACTLYVCKIEKRLLKQN